MKIKIILDYLGERRECDLMPNQWPGLLDGTWSEIHLLVTPGDPVSPTITLRREDDSE